MEKINLFIYYDGSWNKKKNYVNYKLTGIVVFLNAKYKDLLELVQTRLGYEMKMGRLKWSIKSTLALKEKGKWGDYDTYVHLSLKKKEDVTRFLLCIRAVQTDQAFILGEIQTKLIISWFRNFQTKPNQLKI